jgi:hypothetical protein
MLRQSFIISLEVLKKKMDVRFGTVQYLVVLAVISWGLLGMLLDQRLLLVFESPVDQLCKYKDALACRCT